MDTIKKDLKQSLLSIIYSYSAHLLLVPIILRLVKLASYKTQAPPLLLLST
jgi:hypothetical protein